METIFKYKGVDFLEGTSIEVCDIILKLADTNKLVTFKTGVESWEEKISSEGYIVLSKGKNKGVFHKHPESKSACRLYSAYIYQIIVDDLVIYDSTN